MDFTAPDHVLLEALGSNDRTAFDILATRHHGLVHAACLRQAPRADLDDCIQAVFLVLLRKSHQARRAPALAAWLLVVSRHVCATARRAAGKRQHAEHEAAMLTPTMGPDASSNHAVEHLDACLAQLPERQRAVIALHYLAGAPRDEVARTLAIDVDTVHQHCRRGLERLRELLRRKGVAVPAVGVLALLSSQAQAAVSASSSLPTTAASATASAYASGAMTTMTIATIAPASLITAALLIIAGTAIGIANAETISPSPPPAEIVVQKNAQDAAMDLAMGKEIKAEFSDTDLTDVTAFLGKAAGLPILTDPKISPHQLPAVSMSVSNMRLENVLRWVERLTRTHHEIHHGSILLVQGAGVVEPDSDIGKPWRKAMDHKLEGTITFDFADTAVPDALQFIQSMTGLNIILAQPSSNLLPITLKVQKMSVRTALAWITNLCNSHFEQRDQAIGIYAGMAPAAAPAPEAQPSAPGSPPVQQF